jgi:A/G-specific adenine glycosylase
VAEILVHPVDQAGDVIVDIKRQGGGGAQNQCSAQFGLGGGLPGPVDLFRMGLCRGAIAHNHPPLRGKLKAGKAVAFKSRLGEGGKVAVEGFHLRHDHSPESLAEQGRKLLAWYDRHGRDLPWRVKGGRQAAYQVWLSEIMLQQTTVVAVKDYYLKFLSRWPDVFALAAADLDDVLKAWAGLGYYARARNLHACARLVAGQGGAFPSDLAHLMELPGVGPYTAAAIAAIAFDVPVAAVDGNVDRVVSRFHAIETPLPESKPLIRQLAQAHVPAVRAGDFAQAMMDLGATVCTPKSPDCRNCPWADDCAGRAKGLSAVLPYKAAKKKVPTRHAHVYWIENDAGDVLIRQRPMKGLLGGMAEFPSSDWGGEKVEFSAPVPGPWKRVPGLVEHTFTHFHLELTVWRVQKKAPVLNGRFVAVSDLHDQALPSVMRKVAALVLKPRR